MKKIFALALILNSAAIIPSYVGLTTLSRPFQLEFYPRQFSIGGLNFNLPL